MSVKIEILDYSFQALESNQLITDSSFNTPGSWTMSPASTWNITGGYAEKITNTSAGYIRHPMSFQQGQRYKIISHISDRTSGSLVLANHLEGDANGFTRTKNGGFAYEWVQGASTLDNLSLWGSDTFDGKVNYARVYQLSNIDWDSSVVGELDITDHSDFPLALTFQISDFQDLTSTSGDYSKTFKIPATKNNNIILKNIYIPNILNNNTVTNKKPCRILLDDSYDLIGLIQVDGVGGYGETPSYYDCVFFGSNLSWANQIQDNYLKDLDWGVESENLICTKDSITGTWQHEDCENASNALVVYPITSYGDYNETGEERTIQLLDTQHGAIQTPADRLGYVGFDNSGNSYNTPAPVMDWRPSVFVKPTLDKIFKSIGYTINSNFMNTNMFKKLVWLLPNFKYNNTDDRSLAYSVRSNFENNVPLTTLDISGIPASLPLVVDDGVQSFFAGTSGGFTGLSEAAGSEFYTGNGTQTLNIRDENLTVTLDNGSYVDLATNYITIGEYGRYKISISGLESKVALAFKGGSDSERIDAMNSKILIELQSVGQTSWNVISAAGSNTLRPLNAAGGRSVNKNAGSSTSYTAMSNVNISDIQLNKGDKLRLRLGARMFASDTNQVFYVWFFFKYLNNSSFKVEINPNRVEYGQTYNLTDVIQPEYKQIDFIKGIAHAFNLNMTTNESTRTIDIEPFDSFFKPYGDAIDWTYKLDRSKETSDNWLASDLKRNLVFKYKSDNQDLKVKRRGEDWFDDIHDEYPYREELPSTFKKGNSTFENPFFAGTFNGKDGDTTQVRDVDTAYSAILWAGIYDTQNPARPDKGYNFLPRLLYWNKYTSGTSFPTQKYAVAQTWASTTGKIIATTNYSGALSAIYPQATMVNRDSTTSPNLAYGNAWVRDFDDATGIYTDYSSGRGLYETYYSNMIEGLKRSPRLRTSYIALNTIDIFNLDFQRLVYIDGVYWRISKVIDYMPNNNKSTKVELIEWFPIGVFASSTPMIGSSGDTSGELFFNPELIGL